MPDPKELCVGDRIRIVDIPGGDIDAFETGSEYLADTIRVLQWMVGKSFVIAEVDEYHKAWFRVPTPTDGGDVEEHYVAIMEGDMDSWEHVNDKSAEQA